MGGHVNGARFKDREAELEWLLSHPVHLGIDPALKALQDFAAARAAGLPPRNRRPYFVALGVIVVVAACVAGAIAFVHRADRPPQKPTVAAAAPTTTAQVDAAVGWAGRELSHEASVLADPESRAALVAVGFGDVVTGPARADYVVATPALRNAARTSATLKKVLTSSVPIALFGTGTQQVVVRQTPVGSRRPLNAADAAARRTADRRLLVDRGIDVTGAARTVLAAGGLDIRAAAVLNLMASSAHIDILRINVSGAEHAAGLPARSIDIRTDNEVAVQAILVSLPQPFAPSTNVRQPNASDHIVWPIDLNPPTSIQ